MYLSRVIKGVKVDEPSPVWLQERLRRCGMRSINLIVDVLNYVMVELGQPMHAFDLDKLSPELVVRYALNNEEISLLNGQNIKLRPDTLVIADKQGAHAIAGVMGDVTTSVTAVTTNIVLESALFAVEYIAPIARSYNLYTDSAYRFERGVDPQLQAKALERASHLIVEFCGGMVGPVVSVTNKPYEHLTIKLLKTNISRLLGFDIVDVTVIDILERLGCTVVNINEHFEVTVPSYRYDLKIEADLIEELLRIVGYDAVIANPILSTLEVKALPNKVTKMRVRRMLVDRDYNEVITYSFIEPSLQQIFSPKITPCVLTNPISSEMSVMRTSLWPGLIKTMQYNHARQQARVRIFETGLCFLSNNVLEQKEVLGILASGNKELENWQQKEQLLDFYTFKADVSALLTLSYPQDEVQFIPYASDILHPGQAASIVVNGQRIGIMGALHPRIEQELDLTGPIFLAELNLDALLINKLYAFKPISKFPSVRRDLAFIVDKNILVDEIRSFIKHEGGGLLHSVIVFDVYYGDNIQKGCKSIALGLVLQQNNGTLTDNDVDVFMRMVSTKLRDKFNATLRD